MTDYGPFSSEMVAAFDWPGVRVRAVAIAKVADDTGFTPPEAGECWSKALQDITAHMDAIVEALHLRDGWKERAAELEKENEGLRFAIGKWRLYLGAGSGLQGQHRSELWTDAVTATCAAPEEG